MHNSAKFLRQWRAWASLLACGCAFLTSTGCASLKGDKKKTTADPILGEVHPQNTAPYGPAPPEKKGNSGSSGSSETTNHKISGFSATDPLVVPSTTSPAYLASMTKPLPGTSPLAISDGQAPGTFQLTGSAQPLPVPKDPAFVNKSWVAPPNGSGTSTPGAFVAQPSNFVDPQIALLQSRGVTQYRADPQPDGALRLMAVAPLKGNANQVRTYDVTARDLPAAVQAVLQQMDQKQ